MSSISRFLFLALLLIGQTSFGRVYYAYRENGSSVPLTVVDSVITLKMSAGRQPATLFETEAALNPGYMPEPISEGFYVFHVTQGYDPDSLVGRLRIRSEVVFANQALSSPSGGQILLAETFVANFHPTIHQTVIDSINNMHHVEVLDSLFDDPFWLLLRVTNESDLDVLAMANHYHETAEVRFSRPGMVMEWELCYPWDEYWSYQWHFENFGQFGGAGDADIDLDEAFLYSASPSAYLTVAIVDDGFAPHVDFPQDRIIGGYDYFENDAGFMPGPQEGHGMAHMAWRTW